MIGPYIVTFDNGSLERVDADTRDDAKRKAKSTRIRALDPTGQLLNSERRPDVLRDASVKVARVEELPEYEERTGQSAPAPSRSTTRSIVLALLSAGALLAAQLLDALYPLALGDVVHAGVINTFAAQGTAIGATLAAIAAVTSDSLQIPHFSEGKRAWLLNFWLDVQVAGTFRLHSPKFHDNVSGYRVDTVVGDLAPQMPFGARQPLFSGDVLAPELAGSAVAGDIEYAVFLAYFEELSGQMLRGITWDQLMTRQQDWLTVENTIATGATAAWAGGEAITAEIDQFITKTEYAIVGFMVDTEAPAIAYRGPNTGSNRVGGPGEPGLRHVTLEWFKRLARDTGLPVIPVIESDNDASTFIDALQDENGADTTVTTVLCRLRAG